jgi:hypothetical protein
MLGHKTDFFIDMGNLLWFNCKASGPILQKQGHDPFDRPLDGLHPLGSNGTVLKVYRGGET